MNIRKLLIKKTYLMNLTEFYNSITIQNIHCLKSTLEDFANKLQGFIFSFIYTIKLLPIKKQQKGSLNVLEVLIGEINFIVLNGSDICMPICLALYSLLQGKNINRKNTEKTKQLNKIIIKLIILSLRPWK